MLAYLAGNPRDSDNSKARICLDLVHQLTKFLAVANVEKEEIFKIIELVVIK